MEMDIDPSPAHQRSSRKHLRSSDDESYDWSSDVSGQFDDAEEAHDEHRSSAVKATKRRRSNDWPLPEEAADYGAHDRRTQRGENGSLGVGGNGPGYRASPRASPRGSLASLRARHAAASASRGRTSRFVEATMSDSVSEQPPSIYFQEQESKHPSLHHRASGIFRFGKAIASAFNPFGGWGRSLEGSPNKSPQKDVINRAEEAYAELKKAGYQGTNKGHYTDHLRVNTTHTDQTWQSTRHKMEHTSPVKDLHRQSIDQGNHLPPSRSESSASKRSSLQDLCLPKSFFHKSHGSPSAPLAVYCDVTSDEYEPAGLRKQPSRREISRQTKLIKKVSNLEDKLQRARRELRDLTGNEERTPAPTTQPKTNTEIDPASFPRKFVPGALPTLPSERLLDQQTAKDDPSECEADNLTALPSMEDRGTFSFEESRLPQTPTKLQSPKWRSKGPQSSSMGKDRSSRKRKSSNPESFDSGGPPQPNPTEGIHDDRREDLIDSGLLSPPGKAKWHKSEAGESPGSAKRKQAIDHTAPSPEHEEKDAGGNTSATHNIKRSPYVQPRKVSGTTRSPTSKPTTPLRMKKGRTNLRPATSPAAASDSDSRSSIWATPLPAPRSESHRESFYHHPQRQLNPDRSPRTPTRSKTGPTRRRSGYLFDDEIPPVPPLPEELRSSAAKVNVVNRSPKKRPSSAPVLSPSSASGVESVISGLEDYQWPEDIF
ncbi:uncharacterized protein N7479_008790 [Penicillium vulpinum]|uniref:Nuclear RNA binding protein n=1 Tax=Penicillium vulpinum TaxID=29845 RepID=A0A1V6S163_9EURO|nr:uncharacterized protein N7479_008790 [Penicillium vulpinum]KAJ5950377.1 hypothetical protein N7479_008790 [Penicillium vulpinum]OQE07765.1 hypothetical protein PENVUL_c012G06733 [Penicillium vulpinum]